MNFNRTSTLQSSPSFSCIARPTQPAGQQYLRRALALITPMALLSTQTIAAQQTAQTAPNQLPEIVVTSEFRANTLMHTSNSTTALTAQNIQERAAQHFEDVLNTAPNINFASGTSRARYFQIRGVGDRSQFAEPLNASVGFLLDGVDFSGIGSIGTLFDVAQVEILRGPQGTLHGANALAGLISVTSEAPTKDFEHAVEASVGDYATHSVGIISSGPVADNLLYRIAANTFRSDGYQENTFLGVDDTSERDETTVRGRLRWMPASDHRIDFNLTHINIDNGYDAFSLDNTRSTLSDEPGRDEQESTAFSVQTDSTFDTVQLQTRFNLAQTQTTYSYDEDWAFVGLHPDGYSSFDAYLRDRDSLSAEVRLLSNESSRIFGDRTDWVVGVYYLADDEELGRRRTGSADFDSTNDTQTYALYTQLDTQISEQLTLTTGLRWENRDIQYADSNAVGFNPDTNLWGGKLSLQWQWDDDTLAYASLSRGYRGHGINAGILASIAQETNPETTNRLNSVRTFSEETLLNYELGLKATTMNNTLQARIALFYMERDDQQVNGSFLILRSDGATTFIDYTSNAAQGENYGAEIEIDWLASEALQVWANLGLLRTELEEYINIFDEDLSGREQAQAPSYQYTVGARYDFAQDIFARVELEGKDGFLFSDRHDEGSDDYTLLNASVGVEKDNWRLSLWGRNLSNEDYAVRGFGGFGNDPRNGYATEPYYQFGEPRMIGLSGSLSF